MIAWWWLLPAFLVGCALGWHNGRSFERLLPTLLAHFNNHTFNTCSEGSVPTSPITDVQVRGGRLPTEEDE